MGDAFVLKPHGLLRRPHVFLLDTFCGELFHIEGSWDEFKRRAANPDSDVASWLKYDLLCEHFAAGTVLQHGECFSAKIPAFLGGKYETDNFAPMHWRMHLSIAGQLYSQVRDLPAGTRINGIDFKWDG